MDSLFSKQIEQKAYPKACLHHCIMYVDKNVNRDISVT